MSYYKHKSLDLCCDIQLACQTLFANTPIKFFTKARVYGSGRFSYVSSSAHWQSIFLENKHYENSLLTAEPEDFCDQYIMYKLFDHPSQSNVDNDLYHFGMDNTFAMCDQNENHCDIYIFAMSRDEKATLDFYLNNLDYLELFKNHFLDKAEGVLNKLETTRCLQFFSQTPEKYHSDTKVSAATKVDLFKDTARFYLDQSSNLFLTIREQECVNWYAQGKTAEETAIILNLMRKTVEKHWENIRRKLNAYCPGLTIKKAFDDHIIRSAT